MKCFAMETTRRYVPPVYLTFQSLIREAPSETGLRVELTWLPHENRTLQGNIYVDLGLHFREPFLRGFHRHAVSLGLWAGPLYLPGLAPQAWI